MLKSSQFLKDMENCYLCSDLYSINNNRLFCNNCYCNTIRLINIRTDIGGSSMLNVGSKINNNYYLLSFYRENNRELELGLWFLKRTRQNNKDDKLILATKLDDFPKFLDKEKIENLIVKYLKLNTFK